MTITKREVQPKARITYDEMEAFLTLPVPKEGEEYMFFVKNKKQMEIYNDAYGMLKVLDDKNLENVYTNKKYKISEIS